MIYIIKHYIEVIFSSAFIVAVQGGCSFPRLSRAVVHLPFYIEVTFSSAFIACVQGGCSFSRLLRVVVHFRVC